MLKPYRTIEDVLRSELAGAAAPQGGRRGTDRIFRATKLEDTIYSELRDGDAQLGEAEAAATRKLDTFPALSRDIYQAFYSLLLKRNEEDALSSKARKFNRSILDHVMNGEDYPTIKNICEGRQLPAYEAASDFVQQVCGELDTLLKDVGGDKGTLNTLERLEEARDKAQEDLQRLLEQLNTAKARSPALEQSVVDAANKADSKQRQAAAVEKLVETSLVRNQEQIEAIISTAMGQAKDTAQAVQSAVAAWSDDPGDMSRSEVNRALVEHMKGSPSLREVAKYLGRFREMLAQSRKNGYAYGRGEKYSIELGNDIGRAITSELVMLATPETLPLFLRKYQRKGLKQYLRREPVYRGAGDVIVCLDESSSTEGDNAAWGKAVALALLDLAADGGRKFALVHFAGAGSFKTDLFLPGTFTAEEKMRCAETFLDGGTNFETPMREALRLMREDGFENADVVFITDGACAMPKAFTQELKQEQIQRRFTVTGILLDAGDPGMAFSLEAFCQNIYRTSELAGDEIVQNLLSQRV